MVFWVFKSRQVSFIVISATYNDSVHQSMFLQDTTYKTKTELKQSAHMQHKTQHMTNTIPNFRFLRAHRKPSTDTCVH